MRCIVKCFGQSYKITYDGNLIQKSGKENPAPGERPGQVHYHDSNNNKYYYDIDNNTFYDQKTCELAPKSIQKLFKDLDEFQNLYKK